MHKTPLLNFLHQMRSTKLLIVCTILVFLPSCMSRTSLDDEGRLVIQYLGAMHVLTEQEKPAYIDLSEVSIIGFFADGSVTLGYKNNQIKRVNIGCRALVITTKETNHQRVIQLINDLDLNELCIGITDNISSPPLSEPQFKTLQIGLTKLTQSLTYPPDYNIISYKNSFTGLELGSVSGIGHREYSLISSGENCQLLVVASSKNDFVTYRNNLDFKNGEKLCLALIPE